jgi:aspartyl protease family protein
MRVIRILVVFVVIAALLGILYAWHFPQALASSSQAAKLIYAFGLVLLITLVAAGFTRGTAAIAGLMVVLVVGYSYRFELRGIGEHVLGALTPYRGEEVGKGSVSFEAWPDGQFRIDARVNGVPLRLLVDTGASVVVLTPEDAQTLGYSSENLQFDNSFSTANGVVSGAPIVLHEIVIGPIRMSDVAGAVNAAPMASSLLGVSFLDRLKSYDVKDGVLTLTQ